MFQAAAKVPNGRMAMSDEAVPGVPVGDQRAVLAHEPPLVVVLNV
jgi:hypothetical protein